MPSPFERHIRACNNLPSPAGLIPFRIGSAQVGWVSPDLAQALSFRVSDFHFDGEGVALAARLRSPGTRSQALAAALEWLAKQGLLRIRGEEFDVRATSEGPVLATLGTFGGSVTVSGAGELRVKESDRIAELVAGLRAMGADADERPDGFQVRRGAPLTGGTVHARHDHRLAMAFAIAALGATGPTTIEGADAVAVSYPSFFEDLDRLARRQRSESRA